MVLILKNYGVSIAKSFRETWSAIVIHLKFWKNFSTITSSLIVLTFVLFFHKGVEAEPRCEDRLVAFALDDDPIWVDFSGAPYFDQNSFTEQFKLRHHHVYLIESGLGHKPRFNQFDRGHWFYANNWEIDFLKEVPYTIGFFGAVEAIKIDLSERPDKKPKAYTRYFFQEGEVILSQFIAIVKQVPASDRIVIKEELEKESNILSFTDYVEKDSETGEMRRVPRQILQPEEALAKLAEKVQAPKEPSLSLGQVLAARPGIERIETILQSWDPIRPEEKSFKELVERKTKEFIDGDLNRSQFYVSLFEASQSYQNLISSNFDFLFRVSRMLERLEGFYEDSSSVGSVIHIDFSSSRERD